MPYQLQSLLDLRTRAEEDAARGLTEAIAAHAREQARQQALLQRAADARIRVTEERSVHRRLSAVTAADALAAERFVARLDDESKHCDGEALAHRNGPLADARRAEDAARALHVEAHREREAITRHKTGVQEQARIESNRRGDDEASDLAIAAHTKRRLDDRS